MVRAREFTQIDAMIFDTGGTVFDWHTAVAAGFQRVGRAHGIDADWGRLTKDWRRASTRMVDSAMPSRDGIATTNMDGVLLATLGSVLDDHGVSGLGDDARRDLVRSWRDMTAWPDAAAGLSRLRADYLISPFTILTTRTVIDASRRSGISWDSVISCEMIGVYKTRRPAYETIARWLALPHERIMLVTTHNNDLDAAHSYGFRTAFVRRPDEWHDIPSPDPDPSPNAEIVADDFVDLADQAVGSD